MDILEKSIKVYVVVSSDTCVYKKEVSSRRVKNEDQVSCSFFGDGEKGIRGYTTGSNAKWVEDILARLKARHNDPRRLPVRNHLTRGFLFQPSSDFVPMTLLYKYIGMCELSHRYRSCWRFYEGGEGGRVAEGSQAKISATSSHRCSLWASQ